MRKTKKPARKTTIKKSLIDVEKIDKDISVPEVDESIDFLKQKSSDAQSALLEKITETSEAVNSIDDEILPKGNSLEQTLSGEPAIDKPVVSEQPVASSNDLTLAGMPRKHKSGAGRPPKNKYSVTTTKAITPPTPEKNVDIIANAYNGIAAPALGMWKGKKLDDLQFSKEQQKNLLEMMPPNDWMKPSWPNYGILFVSFAMGNFMMARNDDTRKIAKEEAKKEADKLREEIKNSESNKTPRQQVNVNEKGAVS